MDLIAQPQTIHDNRNCDQLMLKLSSLCVTTTHLPAISIVQHSDEIDNENSTLFHFICCASSQVYCFEPIHYNFFRRSFTSRRIINERVEEKLADKKKKSFLKSFFATPSRRLQLKHVARNSDVSPSITRE